MLGSDASERKELFKEWAILSLGLTPSTYDADPIIVIIKHNGLDDILDFPSLVEKEIPELRKPAPNVGDPPSNQTVDS